MACIHAVSPERGDYIADNVRGRGCHGIGWNGLQAFQRVAMFPLPSEGNMGLADAMGMDKPVTLYKYRVRFTRVVDP